MSLVVEGVSRGDAALVHIDRLAVHLLDGLGLHLSNFAVLVAHLFTFELSLCLSCKMKGVKAGVSHTSEFLRIRKNN